MKHITLCKICVLALVFLPTIVEGTILFWLVVGSIVFSDEREERDCEAVSRTTGFDSCFCYSEIIFEVQLNCENEQDENVCLSPSDARFCSSDTRFLASTTRRPFLRFYTPPKIDEVTTSIFIDDLGFSNEFSFTFFNRGGHTVSKIV